MLSAFDERDLESVYEATGRYIPFAPWRWSGRSMALLHASEGGFSAILHRISETAWAVTLFPGGGVVVMEGAGPKPLTYLEREAEYHLHRYMWGCEECGFDVNSVCECESIPYAPHQRAWRSDPTLFESKTDVEEA